MLFACLTLLLSSCTNYEEPKPLVGKFSNFPKVTVKVVTITDHEGKSRAQLSGGPSVSQQATVLSFESADAFESTIVLLKGLSHEEKIEYLESIGYQSAYVKRDAAQKVFESLFDRLEGADSITVKNSLDSLKSKYANSFDFFVQDEFDFTPTLKFEDEDNGLLRDENGYVMINGVLNKAPKRTIGLPTYDFLPYSHNEISVKNGVWKSEIKLGRLGHDICFRLNTYRSILWYKVYSNSSKYGGQWSYSIDRAIDQSIVYTIPTHDGLYQICNLRNATNPLKLNFRVMGFYCTKNSSKTLTKTCTNILIK